ncbi:MAG TPA: protein kinase [Pyrinomonadaceae bacterium]
MKSHTWQRVNQIFEAALEFTAEERGAFVGRACNGDEALRREVESLLAAHNAAPNFMEQPAVAEVAEVVLDAKKLFKGQTIGQYKILRELGKGGQGAVYQALDTKLNRTIALKLLPPELTVNEINRKRFQREAQLASALDHPNICTIHDLIEFDNLHFIVMQFVAGRNIRELVGGRPLELTSALKIAIQVCDALAAAHAQGIIHRDIKAQNVIVTDNGQARILDFGLAKLTQESPDGKDQTELTVQGSPYGTPTYAAPEQSRGEHVDHRADVFSTGILLYEMLTGTWAFHGKTAVDVRHAVLHETPKPIAELRGALIPEGLQAIVNRALAKEPRERFQNIAEMRDELIAVLRELPEAESSETTRFLENFRSYVPRRIRTWDHRAKLLLAGAFAVSLIFVGFLTYRFLSSDVARTNAQPIDSIAVMPFVNAGREQNAEYLSDGITESLINTLSQAPSLRVMSRSAVFRYKDKETDASKVGEELNVRSVLKGEVKQIGDQIAINVELIDAKDNHQIWGDQYVRKFADILTIQRDITQEIVGQLRLKLSGAEREQLTKNYTENAEAYQLYLRGRFYWNKRTAESFQRSIEFFQEAIDKDPNYALAYTGLADSYSFLSSQGIRAPEDVFPLAKDAAVRAIALDDSLAEAHCSLGYVKLYYDWDWDGAAQEYRRAIELNPNYPTAHHGYAYYLISMGRTEEAIAEIKRAQELDPLSLIINTDHGEFYYFARRPDEAIEQLHKALDLDSSFVRGHFLLARAYAQKGQCNEAIEEFQKAKNLEDTVERLGGLAQGYASCGRRDEARRVLNQLLELSKQQYVSPHWIASTYAGLGQKDEAFAWLDKAVERRFGPLIYLKVNPIWDNLRSDSRFQTLLTRVGFPS